MTEAGIQPVYDAVVDALHEVGLDYAFIGALAAIEWGRPRATTDVDVVLSVEPSQWALVDEALAARNLTAAPGVGPADPDDALPDIAVYWSAGRPSVRLDVFIAKTDFERAVLATACRTNLAGRSVPVASPEAVLIYKLLASRPKDLIDVEAVFEARARAGMALDWLFLDHWASEWAIEERLSPWRAKHGPRSLATDRG